MSYLPYMLGGAAVGLAARGRPARETLPLYVTAYHGGYKLRKGRFLDAFFGTGEGSSFLPLGPGFYFHTDPESARLYCKYVKGETPYLYKVRIGPTDQLLRNLSQPRIDAAVAALNRDFPTSDPARPRTQSALLSVARLIGKEQHAAMEGDLREFTELDRARYERGDPHFSPQERERLLNKRWKLLQRKRAPTYRVDLGDTQAARRWLVRQGIGGNYERLSTGWEIAVYNPRLIQQLSVEPC